MLRNTSPAYSGIVARHGPESAAGTLLWSWNSDPFGTTAASGSVEYNLRFPGQYFDAETGLHYNYFRDYDPAIGRYRQSDPIGLWGSYATYTYAGADAIRFVDLFGLRRSHNHHADAKFLGGAKKQNLVCMSECEHQQLHRDQYDFLDKIKDTASGRTMRPKKGNPGSAIQRVFGRQACLQAHADFYSGPGSKYNGAATEFFRMFPQLRRRK